MHSDAELPVRISLIEAPGTTGKYHQGLLTREALSHPHAPPACGCYMIATRGRVVKRVVILYLVVVASLVFVGYVFYGGIDVFHVIFRGRRTTV